MLKKINQCDIYIGLWVLYMLQGVVYSSGIINRLLQLIMLLWGLISFLKYIKQSTMKSPILKATLLLIVMYIIYGGIHILFDAPIFIFPNYTYLQFSLNSLIPIYLFYHFTKQGYLSSDRIRIYFIFFIVTCILLYYKYETAVLQNSDETEITNNIGYMFTSLIPLLFFYIKKPFLLYILMGVTLLFMFMGMKRGAILIGMANIFLLLYVSLKNARRWVKFFTIVLSALLIVGIVYYINYMISNSVYFASRIEQTLNGDSSGRDIIYGKLWKMLNNEINIFYFLFGRGADATIINIGAYAHQDWLETYCNNGLIGVIILFYFFYTLGKVVWKSRYYFSNIMFYSFVSLFIICFSKSLFSMSIQNLELSQTLLLGFFSFKMTQSL